MRTMLTDRDFEILETMSTSVRVFTIQQIAATWWANSKCPMQDAIGRVRMLSSAKFLRTAKVLAMPLPEIRVPLVNWTPGDPAPDFGRVSWMARSRWTESARQVTVVLAGKRGFRLFSGRKSPALARHFQMTHDLGLAEVFLAFRSHRPHLISHWRGEGCYAHLRRNRKVPDAIISPSNLWPPQLVVEFAGAYSRDRVREFHFFCSTERLSYELW